MNKVNLCGTIAALCIFLLVNVSCNKGKTSEVEITEHNAYVKEMNRVVAALSPDRKQQRQKWIDELRQNSVYHALVDSATVSVDYLPVLNAISDGVRHTYVEDGKTMFGISEDVSAPVEKSAKGEEKMKFVIAVTSMSIKENGGMPENIIAIFERYKKAFNLYGQSGNLVIFSDGKKAKVVKAYNLSFVFALFDPKDEKALDGIYEGVKEGISDWSHDSAAYTFSFMNSKTAYMSYLKEVYPDSPYLLKVDFELTPNELYMAYRDNEVAADEKYKGKKIAITGEIENIGKDMMDDPYVSFNVDVLENVTCYFGKNSNKTLSRLNKGQVVTLLGECRGITLQNIVLQKCSLAP